jgi:hypothetical protein
MLQEAVTRLFELSGKTKEMANGKYSENYATFWIAHNAVGDTEGGPKSDILGQAGVGMRADRCPDFAA